MTEPTGLPDRATYTCGFNHRKTQQLSSLAI